MICVSLMPILKLPKQPKDKMHIPKKLIHLPSSWCMGKGKYSVHIPYVKMHTNSFWFEQKSIGIQRCIKCTHHRCIHITILYILKVPQPETGCASGKQTHSKMRPTNCYIALKKSISLQRDRFHSMISTLLKPLPS